MTDLKDHAKKIERIVQALTAEGIGRDIAVSTTLMRYPPFRPNGYSRNIDIDAEILDLAAQDQLPAGPSCELTECAPVHITLMFAVDRGQKTEMLRMKATAQGRGEGSWIYAGELGGVEAMTAARFLRAQKPMELHVGSISRYGTIHRFAINEAGGRFYVMEFKLAAAAKAPVAATASVTPDGRALVDYPLPQPPRLVSLQRARALWELLAGISALDPSKWSEARYVEEVRTLAKRRDQYLSGGHLIVVSDQTREMTAEENAGVVGDAIRDVCMDAAARASERDAASKYNADNRAALLAALGREDSTLTTPQLVAALASERDHYRKAGREPAINQREIELLIDREAQMRAACIDAIGPVSSGSTLDLVRDLAKYKAAQAESGPVKALAAVSAVLAPLVKLEGVSIEDVVAEAARLLVKGQSDHEKLHKAWMEEQKVQLVALAPNAKNLASAARSLSVEIGRTVEVRSFNTSTSEHEFVRCGVLPR